MGSDHRRRTPIPIPRGALLDDKEWDAWLALYAPDAQFWMPSWDDDDKLVSDPAREVSLIYYAHKGGLEDRVFRIRTERSSATSLPEPRTSHNISNVEIIEQDDGELQAAVQLVHAEFPLQDGRYLFRHVVSTRSILRAVAADQGQEGGAEERLHPSRHRHVSHLGAAWATRSR